MTSRLSGVEGHTLPERECVVWRDSAIGSWFNGLVYTLWCCFGVFRRWGWAGGRELLQADFRLHLSLVLACALCPAPPPCEESPRHAQVLRDRTAQSPCLPHHDGLLLWNWKPESFFILKLAFGHVMVFSHSKRNVLT